jgi:thiol-disulfide isomerase/thioredoxin
MSFFRRCFSLLQNFSWARLGKEALIVLVLVIGVTLWQVRGLPEGPAPALVGVLLDGRSANLAEVVKTAGGKPGLVAFWATWCPVCKAEDGNLEAVSRDHPVFTVAMQSEDAAAVAKHMKSRGLSFPVINDPDGALTADWKLRGVPAHFVVDGQGIIRFRVVGYATELGLRARLWFVRHFPV